MNKPGVLSDSELRQIVAEYATVGFTSISYEGLMELLPLIAQAQRDKTESDVNFEWRNEKVPKIIQQSRQDTAMDIIDELLGHGANKTFAGEQWWQALRDKEW